MKTVTITLTQACNLSCSYCYEHHKSPKSMDWCTAKRIIDHELSNTNDIDGIEFDLFGGEPFKEFKLIQQITEYVNMTKGHIPCTIFATTNGTLVHDEVQTWLRDHADCFICGLSLDGTREMHNINRSNSYDDIDLDFFSELYPNQDVKMTISQETLPYLADGVVDLHKRGFLVSCNLAHGIDWSDSNNTTLLHRELQKLIEFYLSHPDIEPCSMLEMGISNVSLQQSVPIRYCGAGISTKSYDINGCEYPCQFFMPLTLGEERAEFVKEVVFPGDYLPISQLDPECQECIIQSVCPNCFGANYASTGNIYKRDKNMCRLTKIMIKARSYFRAKQWELGQLKESGAELQALLQAIVKIQNELVV
ncbi:MAG: 4Fe-4S cluster-binding domain-containing protein [Oscillospiraceae bacterium]|nr:4Fe-4S cluster-binding domain-containing protein [Oscillospiraceae bacterium]